MDLVEIRLHRVDEGDVQTILPQAGRAIGGHAMLVPGAVRCQHKIIRAKRHLVAIDDRVSAAAFHDEADRAGGMAVGAGDFAGFHHLKPCVNPADRRCHIVAPRIVQIDHPPPGLFRRYKINRTQHMVAQILVAPDHWHGLAFRLPRFDLVGDGPQGTCV